MRLSPSTPVKEKHFLLIVQLGLEWAYPRYALGCVPRKISGHWGLSRCARSFAPSFDWSPRMLLFVRFFSFSHSPCSGCGWDPIIWRTIRLRTSWFGFRLWLYCGLIFFLAGADLVGDAKFWGGRSSRSGHHAAMLGMRLLRAD